MPAQKFINIVAGIWTQIASVDTSAGAGDAGKIVALDADGKINANMMPTGIGAETATITASEALSAGNLVNVYNNGGTPNVRKADATTAGKEANGFVLASVSSSASATVYTEGMITGLSGLTPGPQFLATTAGASTVTAPSGSGNVVQRVGVATSTTTLAFSPLNPATLA